MYDGALTNTSHSQTGHPAQVLGSKDLGQVGDTRWLRNARGRVVKIVSPLLPHLPDDNLYRVVFMRRNLHEVLASQGIPIQGVGRVAYRS